MNIDKTAIVLGQNSVNKAQDNITYATMSSVKNPRSALKEIYNKWYDARKGNNTITVDGITYKNRPYNVELSKRVVGKVISDPNMSAEKIAVFDAIDDIIKNGEYVGSGKYIQKTKNAKDTIRFDYFETNANIGGNDFIVAFDVEIFPGANNYRTHKVINKMEPKAMTGADVTAPAAVTDAGSVPTAAAKGSTPINSISQPLPIVNSQNENMTNVQPLPIAPQNKTAENSKIQNNTTIHVGQATTIYSPYDGTVPERKTDHISNTVVLGQNSVNKAQDNITYATMSSVKNPRSALKEIYNKWYDARKGNNTITIDGITYKNRPYNVELSKRVVGKVINKMELKAMTGADVTAPAAVTDAGPVPTAAAKGSTPINSISQPLPIVNSQNENMTNVQPLPIAPQNDNTVQNTPQLLPTVSQNENIRQNAEQTLPTADPNVAELPIPKPTMGIFDKNIGTKTNFASQEDVNNYVDYSYEYAKEQNIKGNKNFPRQNETIVIGKPSERLISDLNSEYGIDVSNAVHVLRDNDIRHIKNSHGEGTNEKYPVTANDLKQIPDIVKNYDDVVLIERKDGKKGLYFVKRHNGVTYYLESINSNRSILQNKQMIKVPTGTIPNIKELKDAINKKWNIDSYPNDASIPRMYVQDVPNNVPTSNVPQTPPIVNGQNEKVTKNDVLSPIAPQNDNTVQNTPQPLPTVKQRSESISNTENTEPRETTKDSLIGWVNDKIEEQNEAYIKRAEESQNITYLTKTPKNKKSVQRQLKDFKSEFRRKLVDSGDAVREVGKTMHDSHLYAYYTNTQCTKFNCNIHVIYNLVLMAKTKKPRGVVPQGLMFGLSGET